MRQALSLATVRQVTRQLRTGALSSTRSEACEGLGHGIPARQQRQSRGETSANLRGPDRGIAALSREGAAETYRRARARPYRRAGNRWLSKPIRRGGG